MKRRGGLYQSRTWWPVLSRKSCLEKRVPKSRQTSLEFWRHMSLSLIFLFLPSSRLSYVTHIEQKSESVDLFRGC